MNRNCTHRHVPIAHRPHRRLLCALAGAALLVAASFLPVAGKAAPGDVLVRAAWQNRVLVGSDYATFLKDRYGVERFVLEGYGIEMGYQTAVDRAVGIEYVTLADDFAYRTLNGDKQTADLRVQELLVKLHFLPAAAGAWELAVGGGLSRLERSLYGYQGPEIVVSTLPSNTGKATVRTDSFAFTAEANYPWLRGDRMQFELGLRGTYSVHAIGAHDERPAYDEKGRPTSSEFSLSGAGLQLGLRARF